MKSTNKPILIAGPCSLENAAMAKRLFYEAAEMADKFGFDFYFKASFDKANRTSIKSWRGLGIDRAIDIFSSLDCKITTDVHEPHQVEKLRGVVDLIQIPAFLCRQTDLLVEAGKLGVPVNIKKGQFETPKGMKEAVKKIGHKDYMLTERGTTFGPNDLVVDFRQVVDMKAIAPTILDCTHSTTPEYTETYARCGQALGVDGFFFEIHHNPQEAFSDGSRMITPFKLKQILITLTTNNLYND